MNSPMFFPDSPTQTPEEAGLPSEKLCFIHLMKCSGTSMSHAMQTLVDGTDYEFFRLHARASTQAARRLGSDRFSLREELVLYQLCHPKVWLVAAEFRFSQRIWQLAKDNVRWTLLLRNPIEHFVSYYKYFSRLARAGDYSFGIHVPFEEFLTTPRAAEVGAHYVERLGGGVLGRELNSTEAIALAVKHLELVDLIGFVDNIPGYCEDFKRVFGPRLIFPKVNQSAPTPEVTAALHEGDTLKRLQILTAPNRAIYEAARGIAAHQDNRLPLKR